MMTEMEKVIKGLEHCTNGGNGCFECPYSEDGFSATSYCKLQIDRDALALLKEQEAVVRCRDCRHHDDDYPCELHTIDGSAHDGWFCADGERKD